ncbi:MAG: FtsW/RodA/SpoVE family cell cycle protein, partial [Candidatus Delongbacteria bacterium]
QKEVISEHIPEFISFDPFDDKALDLGTAVIYAFIFFSIVYAAGLPYYYIFNTAAIILFIFFKAAGVQFFISALIVYGMILKRITDKTHRIILLLICAVLSGLVSEIFWNNLRSYQQNRLLTFLNPEKFSTEGGWQIIQSKTAVFNGKLTGSGFMEGAQTQLRFLPEGHNDFILSVLAEEFGLLGVMILLLSFSYLFYRLFKIVSRTSSRYLYLAGTGIIALLVVQTVMNVYISLGMLPVTGLTLPFVSYGGTALVINMFMVGVIMSIGNQKNVIKGI